MCCTSKMHCSKTGLLYKCRKHGLCRKHDYVKLVNFLRTINNSTENPEEDHLHSYKGDKKSKFQLRRIAEMLDIFLQKILKL